MELTTFENSLFLLLFSAAAAHSYFLSVVLLVKSRRERGLGWLGIMMIPVGLWLLNYLFYLTGMIKTNPHLFGVFGPVLYLIGPIYYFFIKRTTDSAHRFRWHHLLHLLPACYVLWEWWPVFGWTAAAKLAAIEKMQSGGHPTFWEVVRGNRMIVLILGYVAVSHVSLKTRLRQGHTNPLRVLWLKRFTATFAAVLISFIFLPLLFLNFEWLNPAVVELLFVMILVVAIHALGYVVLGKDKVLPEFLTAGAAKYATSPLNRDLIAVKQEEIVRYLESERPWLDPSFSISDLASALNIPRHHVSHILSEGLRQSFYELVCDYRVAEIKRRFQEGDAQRYSILGIAKDCGFGSKSSFNRAFKKNTGMTPMEWLQTVQMAELSTKPQQSADKQ